eukprot:scaffold296_cov102-Amphora_coffeaeformis.AAC.8
MVIGLDNGFRSYLERATRSDQDIDWSTHTIDYGVFKQILKKICRRRYEIRSMLRKSPDGKLTDEALKQVVGVSALADLSERSLSQPESERTQDSANNYINLLELEGVGSDLDSQSSQTSSMPKRRGKTKVLRILSMLERREVIVFLKSEMDKISMFYLSQWQRISHMLELLSPTDREYHTVGDEILELIAFCVINVVAVRQILIRYDAFARTYEGTPMMDYWTKHNTRFPTPFRKLLQHEELCALSETFAASIEHGPLLHFESQRQMFAEILLATDTTQTSVSSGQTLFSDSVVKTLRSWLLVGYYEDQLGLEPSYLTMRGQSLKGEMQRLVEWRKKKHEILPSTPRQPKKLTDVQVFNLTLNLLSGFLYCMNYYIVEPSSTMYVNRLGAFDAMSGTLIGMVPLAAFISSIPYSMWTNSSFRSPFILSCCLLVCGNILYSIADQFSDIRIALLGRFITGLGAPKCIIRRYMADTTPVSLRTGVNALFGMVVAAGSAMGPAMAIILNSFEYTFVCHGLGLVTLNGLTLPGYFMATLWTTFTIIVLLTFEEPDRGGLEEQRLMESASRGTLDNASVVNVNSIPDNDLNTIFSGDSQETGALTYLSMPASPDIPASFDVPNESLSGWRAGLIKKYIRFKSFTDLITTPVRICLGLLLAKVFTIEILVSATSALSKNRYKWQVQQVGTLGLTNGLLVIPFSILIGRVSLYLQDRQLMRYLVSLGICGLFLLVDLSDLVYNQNGTYNEGHALAVGPRRYISGYFLSYLSIQAFEGVIGSTLSKVIPTALASGTFNSGLLATLVDTFGRACGDNFISMVGFISIRYVNILPLLSL